MLAQFADGLGVLGKLFLAPAVRHRTQQLDQRCRRGDNHLLIHAHLDQAGVLVQSRAEERLARKEQHDKLRRRVELAPIGLRTELVDVVPHLARVVLEVGEFGFLVFGLQGLEIRVQRIFGVHHDVLVVRQLDDRIRTRPGRSTRCSSNACGVA